MLEHLPGSPRIYDLDRILALDSAQRHFLAVASLPALQGCLLSLHLAGCCLPWLKSVQLELTSKEDEQLSDGCDLGVQGSELLNVARYSPDKLNMVYDMFEPRLHEMWKVRCAWAHRLDQPLFSH